MPKKNTHSISSYIQFRNSQGLECRGSLVRLSRQQVVFEVYNPYSIVQLSEVLSDVRIHQGDRETYKGRGVVTGLLNTGLMLIVSASLVDPWSDLTGLKPGETLRSFVHDFVADWEACIERLNKPFQVCVGNLRNYLQELSRWLEHWEMEAGIKDTEMSVRESEVASGLQLDFVQDVDQEIAPRLSTLYAEFEESSRTIHRLHVPFHRAFAQRELHPLMMCSPFMHRAFSKPLGFAGDFEMVRMMLANPWEGKNTFARLMNASALRHEAPAAHRNRIQLLHQSLKRESHRVLSTGERRVKILNLGCGPAVEILDFVKADAVSANVDFHLVDFNKETLDHVHKNLIPEVQRLRPDVNIVTEQRSVHEIIQLSVEGKPNNDVQYDMVYCAGLFDYFRDTTLSFLLQLFYSWVKPGGMVLVTNVTPTHSSVAIMGFVLEWTLELRDEKNMLQLAPELGKQETYLDKTGVNVFLEIRK